MMISNLENDAQDNCSHGGGEEGDMALKQESLPRPS